MATLVSPGVSISVTDESFYAPAGAGTVPLIVIATAQDKTAPDGTSTAAYTTKATAGKLYTITSQRELLQNFGNPQFRTSGGTPVHGDETNEYGLAAAYSFLGIANRAYVLRADIDLDQLNASAEAPAANPAAGTIWVDSGNTVWGLKKYDGSNWVSQSSNILYPTIDQVTVTSLSPLTAKPKPAFGVDGNFAVINDSTISFYEKVSGAWYLVGSSAWTANKPGADADFQYATHTTIPVTRSGGGSLSAGDVFVQTTSPNQGTTLVIKEWNGTTAQFVLKDVPYKNTTAEAFDYHTAAGSLAAGALLLDRNDTNGSAVLRKWSGASTVSVASSSAVTDTEISNTNIDASNVAFNIFVNSATVAIPVYLTSETDGNIAVDDIVADIQTALSAANATTTFADQIVASNAAGKVTLVNTSGRDIALTEGDVSNTTFRLSNINLTAGTTSAWETADYTVRSVQPTGTTANATLWYDADISTDNVDMLVHNGTTWVSLTAGNDFQTKATEPTTQSDGASSLNSGDVWLDSSDTENLRIYKHDGTDWNLVDLADQSSPDGILFADFRQSATASLDADAPDPSLYPRGMLGWNYRASGGNVKEWRVNYTHEGTLIGNIWVSHSGNAADGSGLLLRKAQRKAVTRALQAAVTANQEIRNETNRFNLMAVPGYPELADEMLTLSVDRKDTVFALIDPPLRLAADATSTQAWATNSNNAVENGENGLVSSSPQAAVYYPHGLTTNIDGTNIMVPASHMALRTYAFNDQVAFPWFAPAGFQRGIVNNATSVGYLDAAEGEFVPVALNEGQRDTLYLNKINPIGNFPGRGINVFGQKTLNPNASALDRVNVSRLVIYIREQLDDAVKPFLFEPNDTVTRTNAKVVVDRLLGELVSQRGLFDYLVVCDTSNNTPARIDRNELHIDVAIQPVKAVEFIYIPIRIQNTLGSTG